ncbi:MAG: NAD-dependent epimerase/dehydratase family protein [Gemmatimonadetes bacterium]|nr:MAG: NAD-dependent epimerase/dehydratase family protein [Gemmatimonadota bacterium]
MGRRVALTGATGFIGAALLAAFRARGWTVRALTRRPRAPLEGVCWVEGDLSDETALTRLVEGAEAVVHCAGAVRGASQADFDRVNVAGAAGVARAARSNGVLERYLLVSSLAARAPHLSWYARSKRDGEDATAEALGGAVPWAALRPTAVHGPGDREMRPLFTLMRRGWLPVLGPADARVTLLHVDDLVSAAVAWLEHPAPPTGRFELHDGTPDGYNWPRIARIGEEVWGRRIRPVRIPAAALRGAAAVNLALARLVGRAPMLTPAKVRELRHPDWRCDNTAIQRAVGWTPRLDLATALRRDPTLGASKGS